MSMLIFKGVQLIIGIIHPYPNESEIQWRQYPKLPLEQQQQQLSTKAKKPKSKSKPKGKRQPRNLRIEQLYSSSPLSFEELDSSFSRRSGGHYSSRTRTPSRYDDMVNTSTISHEPLRPGVCT